MLMVVELLVPQSSTSSLPETVAEPFLIMYFFSLVQEPFFTVHVIVEVVPSASPLTVTVGLVELGEMVPLEPLSVQYCSVAPSSVGAEIVMALPSQMGVVSTSSSLKPLRPLTATLTLLVCLQLPSPAVTSTLCAPCAVSVMDDCVVLTAVTSAAATSVSSTFHTGL